MKPVAVIVHYPDGHDRLRWADHVWTMYEGLTITPLYVMPPRLTDDEISDICNKVDHTHGGTDEWVGVFARAVEARTRGEES